MPVKLKVLFMLLLNSIQTVSLNFPALNQGGGWGQNNIESIIMNVQASEVFYPPI